MKLPLSGFARLTPQLCKRILKSFSATMICYILAIIDPVAAALGSATYLLPLVSVSMHPGRRVGQMIEETILAYAGVLLGIAFLSLGHWAYHELYSPGHESWALGTLAAIDIVLLTVTGIAKAVSPRFSVFTLMLIVTAHFSYLSNLDVPLGFAAKSFASSSAVSIGVCLLINIVVYPEFGSVYVGSSMIAHFKKLRAQLTSSAEYFTEDPDCCSLTYDVARKEGIYKSLEACKTALTETSFEITYGYLTPHELAPIHQLSAGLSANVAAMLNAWQMDEATCCAARRNIDFETSAIRNQLHLVADQIAEAFDLVCQCISFAYDISDDDSNTTSSPRHLAQFLRCFWFQKKQIPPDPAHLREQCALLEKTLEAKSREFRATVHEDATNFFSGNGPHPGLDANNALFLTASLVLNLKSATADSIKCLQTCSRLVHLRQQRRRRRFFMFRLNNMTFANYLGTGSRAQADELDSTVDPQILKAERVLTNEKRAAAALDPTGSEEDSYHAAKAVLDAGHDQNAIPLLWLGNARVKHVVIFTIKYLILMTLCSFPGFVTYMRHWFLDVYGLWVGYVANLVIETSIGGTAIYVVVRGIGLAIGSSVGLGAFEAGRFAVAGGRVVMCVILVPLFLVGFYVQFTTGYPKAAMVCTVSSTVVILSVLHPATNGTIVQNYGKRLIAMVVGGTAAVAVQVLIFPTRARWLMRDQVDLALTFTTGMLDDFRNESIHQSGHSSAEAFKKWRLVTKTLTLARSYRSLAHKEPRLKRPFAQIGRNWKDIITQIQQLADAILNASLVSSQHLSHVDTNEAIIDYQELFPAYIRQLSQNTMAAVNLCLEAVDTSLNLGRPLPQHLPSAHMAHVRQIRAERDFISNLEFETVAMVHWSASKMAVTQIIMALEKLIEDVRELRGSNQFHSGILTSSTATGHYPLGQVKFRRVLTHPMTSFGRTLSKAM